MIGNVNGINSLLNNRYSQIGIAKSRYILLSGDEPQKSCKEKEKKKYTWQIALKWKNTAILISDKRDFKGKTIRYSVRTETDIRRPEMLTLFYE